MTVTGCVWYVVFTPNCKTPVMITGSSDEALKSWDVPSGEELKTFHGHSRSVFCGATASNDKHLVSGFIDNSSLSWNPDAAEMVLRFQGHAGPLHYFAFSFNNAFIVSGSEGNTARIWNAKTGVILLMLMSCVHLVMTPCHAPPFHALAQLRRQICQTFLLFLVRMGIIQSHLQ